MKVYVLYNDHGEGGCSPPQAVVTSEIIADTWRKRNDFGRGQFCSETFEIIGEELSFNEAVHNEKHVSN